MTDYHHIIQKSSIDLQFSGRIDGFLLQKEVEDWCRQDLIQLLDQVLQPFDGIKDHVRIDQLEITVEAGAGENWKAKLTQGIIQQMGQKLDRAYNATDAGMSRKTEAQSFTEILLFYLENGFLPWWSWIKNKTQFFDQLWQWLEGDVQDVALVKTALKKEVVRLRVATHLPADLFYVFAVTLNPSFRDLLPSFLNDLEKISVNHSGNAEKNITLAFRLSLLQNMDSNMEHALREMTRDFLQKLNTANVSSLSQTPGVLVEGEAIFVSNAGLVIVAAFLPVLFSRLNIVKEGKMIQPSTALCLLYYLVTGVDEAAEFELVLPKLLCGIELNEVIDAPQPLSSEQTREADNLLLSIIEHWSIVKNTSINGLRDAFLQREGKLSFQNNTWQLVVEQKPYDMLLQHIPWNINLVKLSWMKYILKTEWA